VFPCLWDIVEAEPGQNDPVGFVVLRSYLVQKKKKMLYCELWKPMAHI
jgi:hypothetical protein